MSQTTLQLMRNLHAQRLRIFTTGDVATLTRRTPGSASKALERMAQAGVVGTLKRGVWVNRLIEDLDPAEAITHLTAPWPGYVSLQTALSRHGLIDEVPPGIYAVTAGKNALYTTVLAEYRIHHLPERLMWGFERQPTGKGFILLAEPEKAFLDLAYLGLVPRAPFGMPYKRDGRWRLDRARLARYARRFHFPPLARYLRTTGLA